MNSLSMRNAHRNITIWLLFSAFMVFTMAIIGAITRLTDSGLSMVEWRPLMGALPPLSDNEWLRVFDLYSQSPEYHKKNAGMSIGEFKIIFFWEWFHRLWGRLIGLVILLPLIWFWIKKQIPEGYAAKIFAVGCLVGLQGVMGWVMVQSGLVDRPSVSHYRLAAHLSLAFVIFGCLLWLAFSLWDTKKITISKTLHFHAWFTLGSLFVTIIWGAFVAGLDAGLVYNSFPKMNNHWIPMEFQQNIPLWAHIYENHAWVQFTHRWLAILTAVIIISFWIRAIRQKTVFIAIHLLAFITFMQIGLGIATLLTMVWLPIAVTHQAGALILFGLLIYVLQKIKTN